MEGHGRGLMQCNIATFIWRNWVGQQTVRIAAAIQIRHLQNEVTQPDLPREGKRRQKTCFDVSLHEQRPGWSVICSTEGLCGLESVVVCSATWRAECLLSLTAGHFTAALQDPKHDLCPKPCTPRANTIVAASWSCWDASRVFCLEDGGSDVTSKVSKFLPAYTMPYYRRQQTSQSP